MKTDAFSMLMAPLKRRIDNMICRAVVNLVADGEKLQSLQVEILTDETRDKVERFQQYGFTSVPLPGAEAVLLFVGGSRDHALATNVDDRRYRKAGLNSGEVALYTNEGDYILLKNGRIIEVSAGTAVNVTAPTVTITAATKVTLATPLVEMTGDLNVAGDISDAQGTIQSVRDTYNEHTHPGGANNVPNPQMPS